MKKIKLYCCLCLLLYQVTYCQAQTTLAKDTIRFQLTEHNNIIVESILNHTDTVSLMFHTDINSISLTPDMCKTLDTKKELESSEVKSWTGTDSVNYITQNHLRLSNQQWDNLTVWLNMLSGHESDGKFGPNLFDGYLIEINFDHSYMVLHNIDHPDVDMNGYNTFNLLSNNYQSLIIEGELIIGNEVIKNKFTIHSGFGGTIILDDAFVKSYKAIHELQITDESDLKDSFGNTIKTKKAVCNQFNVLGTNFKNMPLSYFDSKLEIQKTSLIGGELLKRFNIFLDIKNRKLHIKPNTLHQNNFTSS